MATKNRELKELNRSISQQIQRLNEMDQSELQELLGIDINGFITRHTMLYGVKPFEIHLEIETGSTNLNSIEQFTDETGKERIKLGNQYEMKFYYLRIMICNIKLNNNLESMKLDITNMLDVKRVRDKIQQIIGIDKPLYVKTIMPESERKMMDRSLNSTNNIRVQSTNPDRTLIIKFGELSDMELNFYANVIEDIKDKTIRIETTKSREYVEIKNTEINSEQSKKTIKMLTVKQLEAYRYGMHYESEALLRDILRTDIGYQNSYDKGFEVLVKHMYSVVFESKSDKYFDFDLRRSLEELLRIWFRYTDRIECESAQYDNIAKGKIDAIDDMLGMIELIYNKDTDNNNTKFKQRYNKDSGYEYEILDNDFIKMMLDEYKEAVIKTLKSIEDDTYSALNKLGKLYNELSKLKVKQEDTYEESKSTHNMYNRYTYDEYTDDLVLKSYKQFEEQFKLAYQLITQGGHVDHSLSTVTVNLNEYIKGIVDTLNNHTSTYFERIGCRIPDRIKELDVYLMKVYNAVSSANSYIWDECTDNKIFNYNVYRDMTSKMLDNVQDIREDIYKLVRIQCKVLKDVFEPLT